MEPCSVDGVVELKGKGTLQPDQETFPPGGKVGEELVLDHDPVVPSHCQQFQNPDGKTPKGIQDFSRNPEKKGPFQEHEIGGPEEGGHGDPKTRFFQGGEKLVDPVPAGRTSSVGL
jgi:hypothetical protein